jgi:glycerophosphoryl diester phosphodiesterase
MLDRAAFVRPIAHRGLHRASEGIIENTAPAFEAAMAKGYGIECDLRPASDGTPFVFHDLSLERLIDGGGRIVDRTPAELAGLRYKDGKTRILSFRDFLDLVGGRAPLLVEIKSEWDAPDAVFIDAVGRAAEAYAGPIALMSFDPAVMAQFRAAAPGIPRGIVSGPYSGDDWWAGQLGPERAFRLANFIESGPAAPDFFAYDVNALPTAVTRFLKEGLGLPLFTWTVRSAQQLDIAREWADAPIFEDIEL